MSLKISKTPLVWLIITVFLVKEAAWLVLIPPREAPDELAHYAYMESLYYEGKIPVVGEAGFSQRVATAGADATVADSGAATTATETSAYAPTTQLNWIAQHPPAYYLLLLPLFSVLPHENVLFCIFILRFVSVFLGAVTIYFSFKTLHKLLPGRDMLNTAIASAIAFLPMFSYMSAVMNNDNLVMALSAYLFYLLVCAPRDGRSATQLVNAQPRKSSVKGESSGRGQPGFVKSFGWSLKVGLVLASLALTKVSALPIFVTVFIIQAVYFFRAAGSVAKKRHAIDTALIFAVPLLIAAWWYIGNYLHFHTFFPELKDAVAVNPSLLNTNPEIMRIFPETGPHTDTKIGILEFLFNRGFVVEYFKSIWGTFGRFFIPLTTWQYAGIFIFMGAGALGWLVTAFKKHRKKALKLTQILFSDEMVSLFIVLLYWFFIGQKVYQITIDRGFMGAMHGRYFFPALPVFFYLLVKGWGLLMPTRWHKPVFAAIIMLFVLNDMATLFFVIIPAFY